MKRLPLLFAGLVLFSTSALAQNSPSAAAVRLANLINSYRAERGLYAIPLSRSLTYVAEYHAYDLGRMTIEPPCNMHSWSNAGPWTPCCFTADHSQSQCMWSKPRELTKGGYSGDGFEIAFGGSGGYVATPEAALRWWQGSPGHHDLIISQGNWQRPWRAMGVAVAGSYALVWFGHDADPAR